MARAPDGVLSESGSVGSSSALGGTATASGAGAGTAGSGAVTRCGGVGGGRTTDGIAGGRDRCGSEAGNRGIAGIDRIVPPGPVGAIGTPTGGGAARAGRNAALGMGMVRVTVGASTIGAPGSGALAGGAFEIVVFANGGDDARGTVGASWVGAGGRFGPGPERADTVDRPDIGVARRGTTFAPGRDGANAGAEGRVGGAGSVPSMPGGGRLGGRARAATPGSVCARLGNGGGLVGVRRGSGAAIGIPVDGVSSRSSAVTGTPDDGVAAEPAASASS